MKLRAAAERGHANFGWLDARHSFSFGHYYDPDWMGHSVLRVINQDLVSPGGGFATHPHANMEILTCMLEDQGCVVRGVANGRACVDAFAASGEGEYGLILMDVMMPVMDGL